MGGDYEIEVLENGSPWNLNKSYRLQEDIVPRPNKNEPISYQPERIPLRLKSRKIKKFSIYANLSGDIDVGRCSSVAFVIPTQDIYNGMGGNNLAEQKNWSVVTENWKEGSTASLTLYTKKDYETLDIQFDLWVFVNGLNDAVDVEILVSPLESSSEPELIKIKFSKESKSLVPSHTGTSFSQTIVDRNSTLGAYKGVGGESSVHPKQIFTSSVLRNIIKRIAKTKDKKLKIAYIGLDTGENFFSVNRALNETEKVSELCLIYHPQWDNRYLSILRPIIDDNLSGTKFKITMLSTLELEDMQKEEVNDFDIVISTFVTSWSGEQVKNTLARIMGPNTLLLSVEPTMPEYVARSYGSLSPNNIWETFRSPKQPKLYDVEISGWADFSSDMIEWSAWSIRSDWEETVNESKDTPRCPTKHREDYINYMIEEGSLIKCAGFFLDCRKLHHAEINLPKFMDTSRSNPGEEHENQLSALPNMSYGMIGGAGVGKSIRFRQLFIERLELIQKNNYRYQIVPIFLQAREFEKSVKKFLSTPDKFQYKFVEFKHGELEEKDITPNLFSELPYSIVFEIIFEALLGSTPSMENCFKKDDFLNMLSDSKFKLELFMDGCDEVSQECLIWIENLCKGLFFDHHRNVLNDEKVIKLSTELSDANEFLEGIEYYEDNNEPIPKETKIQMSDDERLPALEYMVDLEDQDLTYHDLWDHIEDEVEAMAYYLESLMPNKSILESFCLSGRPNVKNVISKIVGANQQRLFYHEAEYRYIITEISPINFSENIHDKIFDGISRALSMNKEPIRTLLGDIVVQSPDAWNHPFRIGWLVYFLCEGKTKQELGVEMSTSSFEKLLIETLAVESWNRYMAVEEVNLEMASQAAYEIITGIAYFSHPVAETHELNKLNAVLSYLRDIYPKWKLHLGIEVNFTVFKNFFLNQIDLYSGGEDMAWSHQRVLDAATALHLEGDYNIFSVFDSVEKTPGIFEDMVIELYPQLSLDRISLRIEKPDDLKILQYVLLSLTESHLSLGKMRFLKRILNSYSHNSKNIEIEMKPFCEKLVSEFPEFCPNSFFSGMEFIEYSDLGGLYSYCDDRTKIKINDLLIERMRLSSVSPLPIFSINEPVDQRAKNIFLRFANHPTITTIPIPLFGEVAFLACDNEVLDSLELILPHVESYAVKCGLPFLEQAKRYNDASAMFRGVRKHGVRASPGAIRAYLLSKLNSEIFNSVPKYSAIKQPRLLHPPGSRISEANSNGIMGLVLRNREWSKRDN